MTTKPLGPELGRDFAAVIGLAMLSLLAGLAINHWRASPLPLEYHSPAERLEADLGQLIEAPAFKLADLDAISLDDLRPIVTNHEAVILDTRALSFYQDGHIPGALNLSREEFARDYLRLRPTLDRSKDSPIVVYCSGGECHDSRLVARALLSLGFTQVKIFTGGWSVWSAAGAPTAR
jgi:rhodanese-related sulfurtransferase